ncbi:DNA-binding protein [Cryobacterium sp. Hh11]|uniref:helix-turn-helix domain-containing protein n=1 Tax=Cryobacterium sp. Hh11 TaxID=2555868 RepID=UPI00106B0F8C|nr:helix-turn-helix domain-containing protein [Cryobacterium sp. Hh11]TFD51997.1 DNA-binding protein [Cryobacterium sp. Hh11]
MAAEIEVERWLPISVVAVMLGVGRHYVLNRIDAGELPVVELGDTKPKQRVPLSALNAFIEKRTFGRAS